MLKLLSKELFSLGTLFFVVVPFVMSMAGEQNARNHIENVKYQATSFVQGGIDSFSSSLPGMSIGSSGGGSYYTNSGPIFIPRS